MATTTYRKELKARVRQLVDEAGGQSAFARRVWGDAIAHKGKVGRWYNGRTGLSAEEVIQVARAFKRRPAWLMFGELPERPGVSRSEAELAADFAAYVRQRVAAGLGID